MKTHHIYQQQQLPISIEECWEFFSAPMNLDKITPDDLKFQILNGADRKMFPGQIITYKIQPFPLVSMNWVTEITHVKDKAYFVDEQRFGPYRFWHHKHFFTPNDKGVLMEDLVHYQLPFYGLGSIAHALFVRKKLEGIFRYRKEWAAANFTA